jgi:hypothetical protein
MLIGLLLAGNLTGFGGSGDTPPVATQTPAGKKRRADEAQAEWDALDYWRKQAADFLDEEPTTQATQDAPSQPRMAGPALTLQTLLDRTEGTPTGESLMRAMAYGKQARIAQAALEAAQKLRRDDDALAMMLVLH